ncbi:MAG TPA: triose-phosphate isomerase [Thermoanaerobaculia bacterium]|nr:triose-phosphate isomerase [Thermoanaerobaculia bacterium]
MTAMTAGAERRRLPLVAANWKMNLLRAEAVAYCRTLRRGLAWPQVKVILFPSFPLLPAVAAELADTEVTVGGQDLHPDERGAHTGDVSAAQLVDAGCLWALCGHSERRRDHGESDELVARKAAAAARHGLLPLVCVGETREERMAERTFEVLARQLRAATGGRSDRLALAYEPVWAIGTGETATAETAEEVHRFLRATLAEALGERQAETTPILYGGSVTPDNAAGLIAERDVDGFLVGGASLDPRRFLDIIAVCA